MRAIVRTGNKQYVVEKGNNIKVGKINGEVDTNIKLEDVIGVFNKDIFSHGSDIKGSFVTAKVIRHGKEKTRQQQRMGGSCTTTRVE